MMTQQPSVAPAVEFARLLVEKWEDDTFGSPDSGDRAAPVLGHFALFEKAQEVNLELLNGTGDPRNCQETPAYSKAGGKCDRHSLGPRERVCHT